MKVYFLLLLIFIGSFVHAEDYFVHSPQMGTAIFSDWLSQNQRHDLKSIFNGRNAIQNLNRLPISAELQSLRKSLELLDQQPMLATEIESAIFLFQKIGLEQLSPKEKRRFAGLLTSSETIMGQHANELQQIFREISKRDPSDPNEWLNDDEFAEIFHYLSSAESTILVDGIVLKTKEQKVSRQPHQWIYLSNSSYPILLVGNFSQFMGQLANLKPFSLICGEEFFAWENLPNIKLKNLGSTGDCLHEDRIGLPSEFSANSTNESSQHHEKMQAWILPMAILGTGAALTYFRNKEITFHTPSFKF